MKDSTSTKSPQKGNKGGNGKSDRSTNNGGLWYFANTKTKTSNRTIEIDTTLADLLKREKEKQERVQSNQGSDYVRYYEKINRAITRDAVSYDADGEEHNNKPVHFICVRTSYFQGDPPGTYINSRTMTYTSKVIHDELDFPEFTFHSLRHTHATMLADSGAPDLYVQHRLGHANLSVTQQVYYHYTDDAAKKGTNILNNIYHA